MIFSTIFLLNSILYIIWTDFIWKSYFLSLMNNESIYSFSNFLTLEFYSFCFCLRIFLDEVTFSSSDILFSDPSFIYSFCANRPCTKVYLCS